MMFFRHRFERAAQHIIQAQPDPPRRFAGAIIAYVLLDISSISTWLFGGVGLVIGLFRLRDPNIFGASLFQAMFMFLAGLFICMIPIFQAWGDLHALRLCQIGTARITRITQQTPIYPVWFTAIVQGRYQVLCGNRFFEQDFTLVRRWGKDLRPGTVMTVLVHPDKPHVMLELDPALDR